MNSGHASAFSLTSRPGPNPAVSGVEPKPDADAAHHIDPGLPKALQPEELREEVSRNSGEGAKEGKPEEPAGRPWKLKAFFACLAPFIGYWMYAKEVKEELESKIAVDDVSVDWDETLDVSDRPTATAQSPRSHTTHTDNADHEKG